MGFYACKQAAFHFVCIINYVFFSQLERSSAVNKLRRVEFFLVSNEQICHRALNLLIVCVCFSKNFAGYNKQTNKSLSRKCFHLF